MNNLHSQDRFSDAVRMRLLHSNLTDLGSTKAPRVSEAKPLHVGMGLVFSDDVFRTAVARVNIRPVKERFQTAIENWLPSVFYLSSTVQKMDHPAFDEILSLGPQILPFVFQLYESMDGPFHLILEQLTGIQFEHLEEAGNRAELRQAWLDWGRDRGFL